MRLREIFCTIYLYLSSTVIFGFRASNLTDIFDLSEKLWQYKLSGQSRPTVPNKWATLYIQWCLSVVESEICTNHLYTNYLFFNCIFVCFYFSFSVPKDRQFLVFRFNYCCSYAHLNFTWYLRNTNSNYVVFVLFFRSLSLWLCRELFPYIS